MTEEETYEKFDKIGKAISNAIPEGTTNYEMYVALLAILGSLISHTEDPHVAMEETIVRLKGMQNFFDTERTILESKEGKTTTCTMDELMKLYSE